MSYLLSDEIVLAAAEKIERSRTKCYEWTDEQFEIWFNHDYEFVGRVKNWGHFSGTERERLIYEVTLALSVAQTMVQQ